MERETEEGAAAGAGDSDAVSIHSAAAGERAAAEKQPTITVHDVDAATSHASTALVWKHIPVDAVLPALLPDSDEKIQKAVASDLTLYRTKNPVVADAVLTSRYNICSSTTRDTNADPAVVKTLFESSIVNGDMDLVQELLDNGVRVDAAVGEVPELLFGSVELLPVHVASRHGQLEILQLLVSRGASLTTLPSPLVLACEHGHLDVVQWLLETCGADVKGNKSAALTEAVSQGHLEIVQYLVSVDEHDTLGETAVIVAARSGKLRVLKSLVANNFTAFADHGLLKQLVLDNAVQREDIGMLRYLLDLGVLSQTEMNKGLGIATQLQNLEILKLLVESGANIDTFTDKREEKTPLFHAIEHNRIDAAEFLLILGADANKPASGDQYAAIHAMASLGRLEMLQLVQRICGNSVSTFKAANKRERHTPLHLAASNGHVDVVRFLLKLLSPDVDIDVETRYDDTPLSLAAENGHLEVVRLLVIEGATINNQTNGGSTTHTLFCAAQCDQFDVVQFLCEQGANVLWRRYDGVSALCIASRNGSADIVEYLAEVCGADLNAVTFDLTALNEAVIHGRTDVVRVLLAHNANTRDDLERRSNLLCQAIVYNKADIARLLVKNGADVNARYTLTVNDVELEVTPLIVAAGVGDLELVKFLCANGADVEDASNENETTLFFAAAFGKLDVVEYLVSEQNANTQSRSSYGFTPADVGHGCQNVDIVACLARHGASSPTRKMLPEIVFNVLSAAESPLLQTGDLADDATYWRRKGGVGSLLSGDFLR